MSNNNLTGRPFRRGQRVVSITDRAVYFTVAACFYDEIFATKEYSGDSTIIDFGGQVICQISGQEDVITAELSLAKLPPVLVFRQPLAPTLARKLPSIQL